MTKGVRVTIFAVVLLGAAGAAVAAILVERSAGEHTLEDRVLVTSSTNRLDAQAKAGALSDEAAVEEAVPEVAQPPEDPELADVGEVVPTDDAREPGTTALIPTELLSIRRSGDHVRLTGAVARLEDTDELVSAVRQAFPTIAIDTQLVQETNLAAGHQQAAMLAVAALSRLAEGEAEVSRGEITVTGRALYAQTPELLAGRLDDATPEGWSVSLDIDAPERIAANGGAQCQQQVVERLAENQIGFAVAAATLDPDAEPLIDELAEILSDCPDVAVEVAGHTDSDGSEAANRRLSQERAAAVRQALSARGVERDRLSAVGYGQAQPIAPNDTPENKARNRRIELIVIE